MCRKDGETGIEHVRKDNKAVVVGCFGIMVGLFLCIVDSGLVAVMSISDEEDVVL